MQTYELIKDGKLFIILCGSSMSFMENQVLGYQSPLYGRRTAQFKINPFTFWETGAMVPGFKPEEQAVLYGATGGIPEYLAQVNNSISLKKNLIQLFFSDNASRIISGDSEQVYTKAVEPHLADFMGLTFEKICLEYLELLSKNQKSPFFLQKIGRWWGNNPTLKRQEEIDLVATFGKEILLGECKWRKEKTDMELLEDLERKSELFPHFPQKHFWVFSKSGFTAKAQEYVQGKPAWKLITFKEMCEQAEIMMG